MDHPVCMYYVPGKCEPIYFFMAGGRRDGFCSFCARGQSRRIWEMFNFLRRAHKRVSHAAQERAAIKLVAHSPEGTVKRTAFEKSTKNKQRDSKHDKLIKEEHDLRRCEI